MDPVLQAAATALATKTAEALAQEGRSALSALAKLVHTHFATDPTAQDTFTAANGEPENAAKIQALADELARAERADPQFGERFRSLWERAATEIRAESGGVVNQISGSVGGHAVQARDINGDISFGP